MQSVAFYTLGCKVNQYETQILMEQFYQAGYQVVPCDELADVYVVNSCTVTATSDKKTRQALRRFKRQNPSGVVALTGCFPQAFAQQAQEIPEADVITGAYNRGDLLRAIEAFRTSGERVVRITPHQRGEAFEPMRAHAFQEHTRAFVKIQDGCERYCAYCIIPTARGPVRSKPLDQLKLELLELARAGYREVVLVGINLSCYGKDLGLHLLDAIALACTTDGIQRVRLGSLEPELLGTQEIQRMSQFERLCPQFHLSLQSGCDATLRRMNRHYDCQEYRRIVSDLRTAFPNAAITTDIMVGFPGESQEEFRQSLDFAREIAFAKVHVFAYSVRPGTRAAGMPDQVDQHEKNLRSHLMAQVTQETRQAFLAQQVGRQELVLFERPVAPGLMEGLTANYTPVVVPGGEEIQGQLLPVNITAVEGDGCRGALA